MSKRNLLYNPKRLKFNNEFFTVYVWEGKFLYRTCLEILDEDGNIVYKEKSYNKHKLHELFKDNERIFNLLKD